MTTLLIMWTERHPDAQLVDVVGETEKALRIRNRDTGKQAWIPKSGLRQYTPPKCVERVADETERVVADWFRARCDYKQMAALGYAE